MACNLTLPKLHLAKYKMAHDQKIFKNVWHSLTSKFCLLTTISSMCQPLIFQTIVITHAGVRRNRLTGNLTYSHGEILQPSMTCLKYIVISQ